MNDHAIARIGAAESAAGTSRSVDGRSSLVSRLVARTGDARVVGIDLRGTERRPSGWALLDGATARTTTIRTDAELVRETRRHRPAVVAIDAPLGLPAGRCCPEDSCPCRAFGIMRACERMLLRRGIRVFPTLLPSMQHLTMRGIRLATTLRRDGLSVIECYPGAVQDVLGIPRKRSGCWPLRQGLSELGITYAPPSGRNDARITHDELDAVTAALTGYFYLTGDYEALGHAAETYLIIPIPGYDRECFGSPRKP